MKHPKPHSDKSSGSTLRWRIVIVLLIASFLPLSLAGIGSWFVFSDLLVNKALEQMRTVVSSHARAIEAHLLERQHLIELLAKSHSLKEIRRQEALDSLFNSLNAASENSFVDLGFISTEGDHLAYVGPYDLRDKKYHEAPWFKEVMNRGIYISDVFMGFRKVPHCIIAVKIENVREDWILRATINSDRFDSLVKTEVFGEGSDVYIVNSEGVYQTAPRVGRVLDTMPVPLTEYHDKVLDRRVQVGEATKFKVTTWINDGRWMLVAEQDLAAVQAPVKTALVKVARVVALAVVVLIVITFIATWHLSDRIDKANAAREELSRAFMRSAKLASIGELATGLAHEINNPLAIISAEQTNIADLVEMAGDRLENSQEILDSVRRSKEHIQRCGGITKKMLQFSRKQDTSPELTDLAPHLNEIVDLMERHANAHNVKLSAEIEDNMPDVLFDPIELEQVLVNLINNSIDALPDGGDIFLKVYKEGEQVHLEVSDNGRGIPPENMDRIFEPFFTTKPVGKGTGLGLSICYGVVYSWGSRIRAESTPGRGTTIHINFPIPVQNHVPKDKRG
ncbi:MAG: sensor histidine kinase [candidate division Zixibacteria bacterium]|nr:sensor histidine kinase [candidate division Zixibacteria bacterium]